MTTTAIAFESTTEQVLQALQRDGARLVSIFATPGSSLTLTYVLEIDRNYCVLHVPVAGAVQSVTPVAPAAAWYERELHEQYGVEIVGHPDLRPLVSCERYPFLQVQGEGVCEVPVGPVHAGIIEPGHFRFSVVGDTVLHLELHHFYTHKGTERFFEGTPVTNGTILAESVSGDNCFAHAVAYCQAVENALGIAVPERADALRLVGLELERILAHVADVGALCGDVGFTVPAAYTAGIKETLLQASARIFGTRCWRGITIPGGVRRDVDDAGTHELIKVVQSAARDFAELAHMVLDTPSVQNRFESTGILTREAAREFGVVGPVARASGLKLDVRRDHPYGAYRGVALEVPHYRYGDVLARARVRMDEAAVSARLICDVLQKLPAGELRSRASVEGSGQGFSAVESPRGELLYYVRIAHGAAVRCHIKSPSFQNWPALPLAMPGNIIADFPLINKSFNLSYSGCDR